MNAYTNAGNAYTEASVLTAPPGRLVVMLYDGAIRFLMQSAHAMREGNVERSRERMRRAEAIVDELNLSLDMSYGEIPARLRAIYLFCKRQLREGNVSREPAKVDSVIRLLRELRGAWETAAARAEPAAA
jgi:flagellar secretion chaperone FliS